MRIELQGKRADPGVAWRRLGDTDYLNRAAHAGRIAMHLVPREGGAPRLEGTLSGPLGLELPFVETRNGWVHKKWFRQERTFLKGPIARSAFLLSLEPEGDGVRPVMTLEVEASSRLLSPFLGPLLQGYRTGWQSVLDQLPAPGVAAAPATTRTLGEGTEAALDRWRKAAPAPVVDAVRGLLVSERDHALRQLRAFEVADRYGLDRMETLVGMLRAVPAGVLEMYWSVRCPRCSGEVAAATTLSDLADHAACGSCRVSVSTDLSDAVEVVFAPHPSIAPRVAERFCTMYPTGAPELFATLPLAAGQELDEGVEVPAGAVFHAGPGGDVPDATLEVVPDGRREVALTVGGPVQAGLRFQVAPGAVRVHLTNHTGAEQRVIVARSRDSTQVVPASMVATLPEFRRELGTDVLSRNVRVGTRTVCLVFTDLSGSTAMYEELGDARAYGLVRDHFEVLTAVIETHQGVLVKTIGDAVMASFHSAPEGLRAALEMRDRFDAFIEARGGLRALPRLNVGVHVGPALAVHTDALGMDWFGRTVNLAARAQGAAKDGALVLTTAVTEDPVAARLLSPLAPDSDWIEVELKGIGLTRLLRVRRDSAARGSSGRVG
jgi:adenylate cyclase